MPGRKPDMWDFKTPGIPDSLFERIDGVPITKEDVRAIQISKARLMRGHTVFDVGCGSGSISVEAALQVEDTGRVVAIDYDRDAAELTKRNLKRFGISNATVIFGNAKDRIPELGKADAIFIGGTGGDTRDILVASRDRLNPAGRVVVGVILIETLYSVLQTLGSAGFADVDVTQITISKSRRTSTGTMMTARNPVTIVSATRI